MNSFLIVLASADSGERAILATPLYRFPCGVGAVRLPAVAIRSLWMLPVGLRGERTLCRTTGTKFSPVHYGLRDFRVLTAT